jgi:carbon monoxide dehydrogenase subunit G
MELNNSFEVPLPPARAWPLLLDVPKIAPCMPGAELTGVIDAETFTGQISVRLGPVALTFAGTVKIDGINNVTYSARVKAQGTDAKGRGGANATADFHLEPSGAGSRVFVHTDLLLTGSVAQYARGAAVVQATAAQLMNEFAAGLNAHLVRGAGALPGDSDNGSAVAPPSKPISGFGLMARLFWHWLIGLTGKRP